MHTTTRRRLAAVGVVAALTAPVAASVASTSAVAATTTSTAPFCGITWGSLPKAAPQLWTGNITGVRSGQHPCFDRVVFDIARGSGRVGYTVRYVNQLTGPGSGLPVPIIGGAKIQITVNAPSTLNARTTTFSAWRTFRQLKSLGSFEGYTDYGLGVRARLPMRVFVLTDADGGRRLVVDVAHRW